ncbi:hypothetical protein [Arthrobacter sp. zg-Y1171]|uniref:hypothetical protein n=1 Tax=Arthrobacter sp. zg-Y1171 TaxID=2964610 RepID=UPI002104BF45|nr:hypothetical protein [Arthrobacter sp. zg-Y1171]MCQ1996095.1 hypothetical protein [Arthrobacter sp. zg-Y1171]UWX82838.1 hypothetical protein N2L00_05350 [Arthrobacter sp. zg-Y1171]
MSAFTTKTTSSALRAGPRRAGAAGAGLALALVLTGCGGGDEPAARDGGAAATATGAGALSGAELAAVLSEVNTDLDIGGTVLEEAQLKQNTARSVEAMKGVEYSPCNPTEGIDPTKALREASMGALAIEGNAPGMPDTISVISWSSEEAVAEESKMSKRQLASCPEYSLTANGRTVSLAGEALDMPTVGDASQAYVTRQTANGTTQTSVVLTAWSGTNSVQITLHEADPQESIRYVAPLLEEVLDRIGG